MCHELQDEFIFGAFNVLWLDITMDDAPKTNASYPGSMRTLNLIKHPNGTELGQKVVPRFGEFLFLLLLTTSAWLCLQHSHNLGTNC